MTAFTWQQRLGAARTEEEVVSAAREFLASFSPFEMARLPQVCRPPAKLNDGDDISAYAFDLVRHECEGVDEEELMSRLARFFAHASTRLTHIASHKYILPGTIFPDGAHRLA